MGEFTDQIDYLTADREENYLVAQANASHRRQKAISWMRKFFLPLPWRLPGSGKPSKDPLHGYLAETAGFGGGWG